MRRNNDNHRGKLSKNPVALIAFFLLVLSAFVFPLFGNKLFGEEIGGGTVMVNLIKGVFNSSGNLNSSLEFLQLLIVIIFCLISLLYLLNGIGSIYNRYSKYASFLTLVYFIIGLLMYNMLNTKYATSLFGFSLSSVSLGLGVYFVPIVGVCYLFFVRQINRIIRF